MLRRAGADYDSHMAAVMVTGAHGFVGRHLVAELRAREALVVAVGKESRSSFEETPGVEYVRCDLLDAEAVHRLMARRPTAVINLAGLAAVGPSYQDPELYLRTNGQIVENICRAAAGSMVDARLLIVSSGAVYDPHQPLPLAESSQLGGNLSPYALSKIESERVANAFRDEGLDAVIVRPFNHIGPGQERGFLLPDLHSRVMSAREGEAISVGNLATARDYTDVRDVVRAYADLLQPAELEHGTYNVCSGRPVAGTELLHLLIEALRTGPVSVSPAAELLRPNDASLLFGDFTRLHTETGWEPKLDVAQSVRDYVRSCSSTR